MTKVSRPDQNGKHRAQFEKNKKRIYASQSTCGICGGPVDFRLKYPHPLSPCIDHIIPIAKVGIQVTLKIFSLHIGRATGRSQTD